MDKKTDIRWVQRLFNYDKALERLKSAVRIVAATQNVSGDVDDLLKEGLIQRFEYTQELAWKLMKDFEEYQGFMDIQGSRDAIRKALQIGIVENRQWMDTIASRNVTSQCYDETEFNQVLIRIINEYLPMFNDFSSKMNVLKNEAE